MKMRLRGRNPFEKGSSPPNPHSLKLLKIRPIGVAHAESAVEGLEQTQAPSPFLIMNYSDLH